MIVHVITGLGGGGAQHALLRLLTAQHDPSASHVVSLTDEGLVGAKLRAAGIAVTCLRMGGLVPSIAAFVALVRLLRRLRPAAVQTWMYHADLVGGLAARLAGFPVYWGVRNSNVSPRCTKLGTRCVVRVCAVLSHVVPAAIVSCSSRAVPVHRALGYADRFIVIPNGLDLETFSPRDAIRAPLRRCLGLPAAARVVGHVGRHDPQKDHPGLIAAFAELAAADPAARLVLAGTGMAAGTAYLQALLEGTRIAERIVPLGWREDIADVMQVMDVLVVSSYGEAFPNVVIEAMACGVPCVVTDVGDAAEILGGTGWVVRSGDSRALAAALRQALDESPRDRADRARRARRRVEEHYAIDGMVLAYRNVWHGAAPGEVHACAV